MERPTSVMLAGAAMIASLVLATSACSAQTRTPARPAPIRADTSALRRTLDSIADAHRGIVGYGLIDLDTGTRLSRRGDETFPTASLIKVAILVTAYDLIAKGELSPYDPLTVLRIDQVPGSGILQHLHNGLTINVRDAAWLMITLSDNTATNLLLDRIIIRRVWDKMEALGLPHTKVHSKSFRRNSSVAMDSSVKYGLGVTTPNEMARLFELLAAGKAVNPVMDSTMLHILRHTDHPVLMQRFTGGVSAAYKTGSTDQVRSECALFFMRNRVVACVMTKENRDIRWILDSEPQLTLARMGEAIVGAWGGRPPTPR